MVAIRSRLSRLIDPLVGREPIFTIGIYRGPTPFSIAPTGARPVITARHVTDVRAHFVADPFMLRAGDRWSMFFEVLNRDLNRGQIGLATSRDGLRWRYERIVLAEPFHLSYPYVFEHDGAYYMIPETYEANAVRLYKAVAFPHRWAHVGDLLTGADFYDASIFRHGERWWLFAGTNTAANDTLRLYSAPALGGPYVEHAASPVIAGDPAIARPGGRVLVDAGRIYRFTQNCAGAYGLDVRAFEITTLSVDQYAERAAIEHPLLSPSGKGWNAHGMHHVDLQRAPDGGWIACVDGYRRAFYHKGRPMGEAH
jgi:hypothetical protein